MSMLPVYGVDALERFHAAFRLVGGYGSRQQIDEGDDTQ